MTNKQEIKQTILIITHYFATGISQELRDYFNDNNVSNLAFIDHPFSYSDRDYSSLQMYKKGKKLKDIKSIPFHLPDILLYGKDLLLSLYWIMISGNKFDICFAADNLNCLAAIIAKKFGYIKKIVYISVDYTPQRFGNPILNWVYHSIDSFACYNSDIIWNSSDRMVTERAKKGVKPEMSAPSLTVVDGNHSDKIKKLPINKINRHTIVYLGHLRKGQGLDIIFESFQKVARRIPKAKLIVIGTGDLSEKLQKLAKILLIEKRVDFKGFIQDHADVDKILSESAIGLAIYEPDKKSFSFFSDVGKPKAYLGAGLPVIITDVPEIAKVISKKKAGLMTKYTVESVSQAMYLLLTSDQLYKQYRINAIKLGKEYTWNNIFSTNLKTTYKAFGFL